jgi:uncharacterized protein (DUF2336 family)
MIKFPAAWSFHAKESYMIEPVGLSVFDVERLLNDPSAGNRAIAADKIGRKYIASSLKSNERRIAEDIFHLMVKDVEVSVRKALAESVAFAGELPKSIAMALATDVASVALPFLEVNTILDDDDLINIVRTKPLAFANAIAGRKEVSAKVSDVLVDTGDKVVVERLVRNEGAIIAEPTFVKVLDRFGDVQEIVQPMAAREQLPLKIAERLVTLVSEKIRHHLVQKHGLSRDAANAFLDESRERTTVTLLDATSDIPDIIELAEQLHKAGRLTPSIILRALCLGDINFFEVALARRAKVPLANIPTLLADNSDNGLRRLFDRAVMPEQTVVLARNALDLIAELESSAENDVAKYRQLLLQRLNVSYGEIVGNDLDQFVAEITKGVPLRRHS